MFIILVVQMLLLIISNIVLEKRKNEIPKNFQYFVMDFIILISYAYILKKLWSYHTDLKSNYKEGSLKHKAVKSADREVLLFFLLICQVLVIEFIY